MKLSIPLMCLLFSSLTVLRADTDLASRQNAAPVIKPEQINLAIKEKLSPVITAALQEHCGDDCPSFRVDTQFKNQSTGVLDDLGFSKPADDLVNPELKSVSVSVLVQDQVPQASKEALKQILAHQLSNQLSVPISVQLKNLSALSPYLDKKNRAAQAKAPTPPVPAPDKTSAFQWTKTVLWPGTVILFLVLSLVALVLVLKHRKDLLVTSLRAQKGDEKAGSEATLSDKVVTPFEAKFFLEQRQEDLLWLIEDLAKKKNLKLLRQIVSVYQPQELSSKLRFSEAALKELAALPLAADKSNRNEILNEMKKALDQAHWKRVQEISIPLTQLNKLSNSQRNRIFASISSFEQKAAFLGAISEDHWPYLLSGMNSDDRIRLGLALNLYQNAKHEDRVDLEGRLAQQVGEMIAQQFSGHDHIVEDFTLYLNEKEGQRLWNELSLKSVGQTSVQKPPSLSMDGLIQGLNTESVMEIFTSLDIPTLSVLMEQLSPESRLRVLSALPKGLKDRMQPRSGSASEEQMMKARANFLDTYRRFSSGSMVQ